MKREKTSDEIEHAAANWSAIRYLAIVVGLCLMTCYALR